MTKTINVQEYLKGLDYPANKQSIMKHAKTNGADHDALNSLRTLPDRQFESYEEIAGELSNESENNGTE